jgi:hypothetical protein
MTTDTKALRESIERARNNTPKTHAEGKGHTSVRTDTLAALLDTIDRLRNRVEGLEQQHHRDSAQLRRLCAERDEQRDRRLAALERAAEAESRIAALELERDQLRAAEVRNE